MIAGDGIELNLGIRCDVNAKMSAMIFIDGAGG
jgi:hypothetical protein